MSNIVDQCDDARGQVLFETFVREKGFPVTFKANWLDRPLREREAWRDAARKISASEDLREEVRSELRDDCEFLHEIEDELRDDADFLESLAKDADACEALVRYMLEDESAREALFEQLAGSVEAHRTQLEAMLKKAHEEDILG